MSTLTQQTKEIVGLLPKIARNLQIAPLIDELKPRVTTSQFIVLLALKDMKDTAIPVGKLAQELSMSFPVVSGIVDRLQRDKLIVRKRSKHDRRIVLVKLSDTGRDILEKLLNTFGNIVFDILEKMPEADQQIIIHATQKVFTFSIELSKNDHDDNISLSDTLSA